MKHIDVFQTRDGMMHTDHQTAKRHASKTYGEALSRFAHRLLKQEKYLGMCEFLEENLEVMQDLINLYADIMLEDE